MQIPDEVIEQAEEAYDYASRNVFEYSADGLAAYAQVIAEWARKEALKDAEIAIWNVRAEDRTWTGSVRAVAGLRLSGGDV